jgi:hypothetical protein
VIVAVAVARIGTVVAVKVVEVKPAGTVTVAGTVTLVKLDVRVTIAPPAGAGPVNVTVPVEEAPPATLVGETLIPASLAAATSSVLVFVLEPSVAEIVTVSAVTSALVAMLNVAVVLPARTVTDAGAIPVSVTVPTEGEPPMSELGARVNVCSWKACRPRTALCDLVPIVPVMVTATLAVTGVVLTVNVVLVVPAGTVTEAGTVAFALLDERVTTSPFGPAGATKVTVPVEELPPIKEFGDSVIDEIPDSVIVRLAV